MTSKREDLINKLRGFYPRAPRKGLEALASLAEIFDPPKLKTKVEHSELAIAQVVIAAISLRDAHGVNEETKRRTLQEKLREAGIIEEVDPAMARLENENEHQRNEHIEFRRQITQALGAPGGTDLVHAVGVVKTRQERDQRKRSAMESERDEAFKHRDEIRAELEAARSAVRVGHDEELVPHLEKLVAEFRRARQERDADSAVRERQRKTLKNYREEFEELQKKIDAKDTENTLRAQRDLARAQLKEANDILGLIPGTETMPHAAVKAREAQRQISLIRKAMDWPDHGDLVIGVQNMAHQVAALRNVFGTHRDIGLASAAKGLISALDSNKKHLDVANSAVVRLREERDKLRDNAESDDWLMLLTRVRNMLGRAHGHGQDDVVAGEVVHRLDKLIQQRDRARSELAEIRSTLDVLHGESTGAAAARTAKELGKWATIAGRIRRVTGAKDHETAEGAVKRVVMERDEDKAARDRQSETLRKRREAHDAELGNIRRALRTEESDLAEAARRLSRQSIKISTIRRALGMTWGDQGVVKRVEELIEAGNNPELIEEIRKLLCTTHTTSIVMDLKGILARSEKQIDTIEAVTKERDEAVELRDELRFELGEARRAVGILDGDELAPHLEKLKNTISRVRIERDAMARAVKIS